MEHLSFPNESAEYRTARNALLDAEIALRRQLEAVAPQCRSPPPGGEIPEDYVFEQIGAGERPEPVRLSELFGEHPSILLSSFMYGPERDQPCDGCMQPPIPCPNSTPAGSPCPPAVLYSNRVQPCSPVTDRDAQRAIAQCRGRRH